MSPPRAADGIPRFEPQAFGPPRALGAPRCSWCPGSAPMPKIMGLHALPAAASEQTLMVSANIGVRMSLGAIIVAAIRVESSKEDRAGPPG
jgi:hypothetical protein